MKTAARTSLYVLAVLAAVAALHAVATRTSKDGKAAATMESGEVDGDGTAHGSAVIDTPKRTSSTSTGDQTAPRDGERSPSSTLPSDSRSGEIRAILEEIERWKEKGEKQPAPYQRLLEGLVAIGTDEAIGEVLRLMGDASCWFYNRAGVFAEVLAGVEDPRIAEVALRVLEANLAGGSDTWPETQGYMALLVAKGGPDEAKVVVRCLGEGGQVAAGAAELVALLDDPSLIPDILQTVRDDPSFCQGVLHGLAQWESPEGLAAVEGLVEDVGYAIQTRCAAAITIATSGQSERGVQLVSRYWDTAGPEASDGRLIALSALAGLKDNEGVSEMSYSAVAIPVVEDALLSRSSALWKEALWIVRDSQRLHVPRIVAALGALRDRLEDERDKKEVSRVLAKLAPPGR